MPGPLAPPEPTDPSQDALVLRAADAAEVVTPDDAPGMVPVDADRQSQIAAQAREFVEEVANLDPRSPAFTEKVDGINAIAGSEIARSGGFSSRMLERSQSSVAGAKRSGDDAQVKVATTLGDLRSTVEDLTPNQADLSTGRKILGMIPGGNKLAKYFQRYESAQTQLDKIIKSLMAGQDEAPQGQRHAGGREGPAVGDHAAAQRVRGLRQGARRGDGHEDREPAERRPGGRGAEARVRRALPGAPAAPGHPDPARRVGAGLPGDGPGPEEQHRASSRASSVPGRRRSRPSARPSSWRRPWRTRRWCSTRSTP